MAHHSRVLHGLREGREGRGGRGREERGGRGREERGGRGSNAILTVQAAILYLQ